MAKDKFNKALADSLNKKGLYENMQDYYDSLNILKSSKEMEYFGEGLLNIYKEKYKRKIS